MCLIATLEGVLERTTYGPAQFLPYLGCRPRLPAPQGWSCPSFSIPCLFIKVKCNYIISLYASNFHSESDLHLIKENSTKGIVPNHTISALTLPSNGNLGRKTQSLYLAFVCTTVQFRASNLNKFTINLPNYLFAFLYLLSTILNRC